uniref:Uncharacterized protein n=1 Tax=Globodera rostochiensis TaxID=31243 RepID=A0A914H383_GLORO
MQLNPKLLLLILTPIVCSFPVEVIENGIPEVNSNPVEVIENGIPEVNSNPVEVIENGTGTPEFHSNPVDGTPDVHSNPVDGIQEKDIIEKFLTLLELEAIVKQFIKASTKVLLNSNDGKNELDDLKTAEELYQKLVSLTETLGLENLSMFEAAKYFVDDFPHKSAVFKPAKDFRKIEVRGIPKLYAKNFRKIEHRFNKLEASRATP